MASPIAWSEVVAMAPELGAVSPDYGAVLVTYVNSTEGPDVALFGGEDSTRTRLARMYLAAHMGCVAIRGVAAGAITSESEGGLSRSYAAPMAGWHNLQLTAYGQMYNTLVGMSPAGAGFVS